MIDPVQTEISEVKWPEAQLLVQRQFGKDTAPDLNAVLMLIGINEVGIIKDEWTKEEKEALMHVAICTLLEKRGFFELIGKDGDGWPHWEPIGAKPNFNLEQQEIVLKYEVISYLGLL